VLDDGIAPGDDGAFMAVDGPADQVGRLTVGPVDFEDLAIPIGVPYVMAFDDEAVAGLGPHVSPFAGASTMRPVKLTRQGPMALQEMTFWEMAGW